MGFILNLLKFVKIGKIIFEMTEDTLEIVTDKRMSNKKKGIEILKSIPDNVLELGLERNKKNN